MKKVLFYVKKLGVRGVMMSTLDYARYNQTILGNESTIIYSLQDEESKFIYDAYKDEFNFITFNGQFDELDRIASCYDVCYAQRAGVVVDPVDHHVEPVVKSTKFCVHAAFQYFDPHGDVYAYISEWLSKTMNNRYRSNIDYVPYILDLPPPNFDARVALNIPKDALVVGRYGGYDTFDLDFVQKFVADYARNHRNVYFLFPCTKPFCSEPNVMFTSPIATKQMKSNFINACDVMLHARQLGESNGLAISEFLYFNKPVFAWTGGYDRNHSSMLENHATLYTNESDLRILFDNIDHFNSMDFKKIVSKFGPTTVMRKFESVFLS